MFLRKLKASVLSYLYSKKKDVLENKDTLELLVYALDAKLITSIASKNTGLFIVTQRATLEEFVKTLSRINIAIKSDASVRDHCSVRQHGPCLLTDYLYTTSKGNYVEPIIVIKELKNQVNELIKNYPQQEGFGVRIDNAYILNGFIIREIIPTLVTLLEVSTKN